jgi:hypothetical protein
MRTISDCSDPRNDRDPIADELLLDDFTARGWPDTAMAN